MLNKKILLTASITTALIASPIVQGKAVQVEINCDGKLYSDIVAAQYNSDGSWYGTPYDQCRNTKAFADPTDDYHYAGGAPTQQAIDDLDADDYVKVYQTTNYWLFLPIQIDPSEVKDAVLFVPGANVDSASYAPLAHELVKNLSYAHHDGLKPIPTAAIIARYPERASESELGKIIPPCNVMDDDITTKRLRTIHKFFSPGGGSDMTIENWVLGGHSEGGIGMAEYFREVSSTEEGLEKHGIKGAFWLASYPSETPNPTHIPADFCSLGIAGDYDIGLDHNKWHEAKMKFFPDDTIYFDYDNGFDLGIHSYLGSYCPLTPDPNAFEDKPHVVTGELKYYELAPQSNPNNWELLISRNKQDIIIFGDREEIDSVGYVGNFVESALRGDKTKEGRPICQIPFAPRNTDTGTKEKPKIGFYNGFLD